LNLTVDTLERD